MYFCDDHSYDLDIVNDPGAIYDRLGSWTWAFGDGGTATGFAVQHTYDAPGIYTVTLTVNDAPDYADDPPAVTTAEESVRVTVFGGPITASRDKLKWYCGAALREDCWAVLQAAPDQPAGTTYEWTVLSGPARIYPSGSTASLLPTDGSVRQGDIMVRLRYANGGHNCDWTMSFTSLKPTMIWGPVYADSALFNGFETVAMYTVHDQFGYAFHDFPAGESFEGPRIDDQVNDWPSPTAQGGFRPGPQVYDTMAVFGQGTPEPVDPTDVSSWEGVFRHTQHLWVGSEAGGVGCHMKQHSQHFYRGHGRHE